MMFGWPRLSVQYETQFIPFTSYANDQRKCRASEHSAVIVRGQFPVVSSSLKARGNLNNEASSVCSCCSINQASLIVCVMVDAKYIDPCHFVYALAVACNV
jgi:hypothetical protein